jgi:hypothetical protein
MPATTGISAVPAGRIGGEVQAGIMPIYRLSTAARGEERHGDSVLHLSALFDPDELLGVPGLFIAGRAFGKDGDTTLEPLLGYRRTIGILSVAGIGFGTKASGEENGASYEAIRAGGEAVLDAKIVRLGAVGELHAQGALNATYLSATGAYCVNPEGDGVDCAEDGSVPRIDGELAGLYSAATLSLSLDLYRRGGGPFHGARLAGMFAVGHMPRLIDGRQQKGDPYVSGGFSLTLGFGAR